jgi:hypothetical protein
VGTARGERIVGTSKRDFIAGLGGDDVIDGRGGNDVICGGPGNDRLIGGAGDDALTGQVGNDDLSGGVGTDTCYQGGGTGSLVSCELPTVELPPAPPADAKVFAIAYSDLDGDHAFGAGDVLISEFVDGNGDGRPNKGDTIVMGQYPIDPDATSFEPWRTQLHAVVSAHSQPGWVTAETAVASHDWIYEDRELYVEQSRATRKFSGIWDWLTESAQDNVLTNPASPSKPVSKIASYAGARGEDDRFIDVDLP